MKQGGWSRAVEVSAGSWAGRIVPSTHASRATHQACDIHITDPVADEYWIMSLPFRFPGRFDVPRPGGVWVVGEPVVHLDRLTLMKH